MNWQTREVQQRLNFIQRTIGHAAQACADDVRVPDELKQTVGLLNREARHARRAAADAGGNGIRRRIEDLAQLSDRAQRAIGAGDGISHAVKSAVILTHLEVSALRHRLDWGAPHQHQHQRPCSA